VFSAEVGRPALESMGQISYMTGKDRTFEHVGLDLDSRQTKMTKIATSSTATNGTTPGGPL